MSSQQDHQLGMHAVVMARGQRSTSIAAILHIDRGRQFSSGEYLRFLVGITLHDMEHKRGGELRG